MEQLENKTAPVTLKQIIQYSSWFNDYQYMDDDFIIFKGMEIDNSRDYPTKANITVFGICTSGHTTIMANLKPYTIHAQDLLIIAPNVIVEVGDASPDFDGHFLAISREFSETVIFRNIPQLVNVAMFLQNNFVVSLNDKNAQQLLRYFDFIWSCTEMKENPFTKESVRYLLSSMALWLYGLIPTNTEVVQKSRQDDIVERFLADANKYFCRERKVFYYARQQFITPKYLSMVVKQSTSKTVSQWINDFVMLEAKAQLKTSTKTIQEIAVELNFPNQSFFGKYFKKNEGISPSEYRNRK